MEHQTANSTDTVEEWFLHCTGTDKKRHPLSLKSATVINSQDVHFGDRTYYDGPVVIKQYILVDDDEYLDNELEGRITADGQLVMVDEEEGDVDEVVKDVDCDGYKVVADIKTINTTQTEETKLSNEFFPADASQCSCSSTMVKVTDSTNVHFGTKTHYKGPITLERLLYPKTKVDFYALESKLYLNSGTDASAKHLAIISRIEWLAKAPIQEPNDFIHPLPYIIINHTASANCTTRLECMRDIRTFQNYHVNTRQWWDIGYNFLVGADGNVYDGRGWRKVGAHTKDYNPVALGVAFVGTFSEVEAPRQQVAAFWRLVREGVRKGYVSRKFRIFGARQLRPTESPGRALYEQIKTWPRWQKTLEITEL